MTSLRITSSFDSSSALSSPRSFVTVPPSPAASLSHASPASSSDSLNSGEDENATVTIKQRTVELGDLQLLAISTHMTELSYAISDIQARTFEIQELRHKPHSSGDSANTSTIIDQTLAAIDEKLDSVTNGIKSINDTLDPLLRNSTTPTISSSGTGEANERVAILRKHAALLGEWEAVQKESQVLREELKEDKWLTVFRTVTDQADGMMSSLEKAVNRCQDFIFQFHRKGPENPLSTSQTSLSSNRNDKTAITFEVFNALQDSYEAKKKHYMPATSKVLSIIDKGVQERVTKNGETLRRHAESAQRWRNLRERITRTDIEMETVRRLFLTGDASSEADSSVSSRNGYLATPPSGQRMARAPSASSIMSGTMSPFRMLRKLTNSNRTSTTPLSVNKSKVTRTPSSEPPPNSKKNQKISLSSSTRGSDVGSLLLTPERPVHRHSQSLTPQSSPRTHIKPEASSTDKSKGPQKPTWNSSTKVEPGGKLRAIGGAPHSRAPSASGNYPDLPASYRRSVSRTSMASSRPWSPITSSSTTPSHLFVPPPLPTLRPPSRPQTPSQNLAPATANTPRPRPRTPSNIPAPKTLRSISTGVVEGLPVEGGFPLSPTYSLSGMSDTFAFGHPPRPPSRSSIPVPSLQFSTPSRPSTSMSKYGPPESPTSRMSFRGLQARAQTPEIGSLGSLSLRAGPMQQSISGSSSGRRSSSRPPIPRLPPSSFRDGQSSRAPSRPGSRAGAHTPATSLLIESWLQAGVPTHEYIPINWKDPLDVEVARVLNSVAHGFRVERLDPPARKVKEGEEIQAKYSFSTMLGSKNIVLKLTSVNRRGEGIRKVMCRVGGGWQDLTDYVLNRQT